MCAFMARKNVEIYLFKTENYELNYLKNKNSIFHHSLKLKNF